MNDVQRMRHLRPARPYDPNRDDRGLWLAVAWTLVVLNIAAPIALVFIAGGGW